MCFPSDTCGNSKVFFFLNKNTIYFDLNAQGCIVYFPKILIKNFKNIGGIKESYLLAHALLNSIKHGNIHFSVKICPREKYIHRQSYS